MPSRKERTSLSQIAIIGVDPATRVFRLHGARHAGFAAFRKRLSRGQLLASVAQRPKCIIAMDACAAHQAACEDDPRSPTDHAEDRLSCGVADTGKWQMAVPSPAMALGRAASGKETN